MDNKEFKRRIIPRTISQNSVQWKVNCNLEMEFAGCENYNVSKCGFAAAFPDMVIRNRICNRGEISHRQINAFL